MSLSRKVLLFRILIKAEAGPRQGSYLHLHIFPKTQSTEPSEAQETRNCYDFMAIREGRGEEKASPALPSVPRPVHSPRSLCFAQLNQHFDSISRHIAAFSVPIVAFLNFEKCNMLTQVIGSLRGDMQHKID